ncbi:MAG: molybdate ABC transporter substrate-binding protein [Actinomycetota bacterium]
MLAFRLASSVLLIAVACGGGSTGRDVTVLAAASLTAPFEVFAEDPELARAGVDVILSVGSSTTLATQIVSGAPADVFASADLRQIERLADADLVSSSKVLAANRLQIVAPADNPAGIRTARDLAAAGVSVVLAAPEVPAGIYARRMFRALGIDDEVEANVVSNEQDVKGVLTKIRSGEADAGVVYVTDVTPDSADEIEPIETPDIPSARATYGIAILSDAPHPDAARAFVARVLSLDGREVMSDFGFGLP